MLGTMAVELYDTLTRQTRPLRPEDGERFRMYCCGPTVYKPSHIGHFRTYLMQDLLRRVLTLDGLAVYHIRNITDVDDKTIRDSQAQGLPLRSFTDHWISALHKDCDLLGILPPHKEPRATDHIAEQIALIERLLAVDLAYVASDGSVYFRVAGFDAYGKLSHLDRARLRTQAVTSGGERNLADEYERDAVADFALWKARKPEDGENAWPSPWGKGRPGWHIECSAMSMKYLGETFDLHGGGEDLCFPHHENEIAQSEGATGKPLCHHWFHSTHLMVEGRKMSKSLDNFHTLEDVLARGFTAMELRYLLLSGHYRQQLNFTWHGLEAARAALGKLRRYAETAAQATGRSLDDLALDPESTPPSPAWGAFGESWDALRHDLNTSASLGALFAAIRDNPGSPDDWEGFRKIIHAFGISPALTVETADEETAPDAIQDLARQRWEAKQRRDFAEADRLRAALAEEGWQVRDRRDGYDLTRGA